ncbi:MAG: hypothetical protein JNJ55_02470 [Betaproteobacteria bacterium]|nr:hypothetical protein [Betaproteobacteria bacterium]
MNEDSKLDSSPEIQAPLHADTDPRWVLLRPSRAALGITVLAAAAALAVIALTPLPFGLRVFFLIVWIAFSYLEFTSVALISRRSVVAFALRDADAPLEGQGPPLMVDLRLRATKSLTDAPEIHGAQVLHGGVVTPWFTALKYRLPDDPRWRRFWPRVVPVWFDALDADSFRKLRVALKWK